MIGKQRLSLRWGQSNFLLQGISWSLQGSERSVFLMQVLAWISRWMQRKKKVSFFFFLKSKQGWRAHPYFNRPMNVLILSSSAQMVVVIIVLQMHFPSKQGKMSPSAWATFTHGCAQVCSDGERDLRAGLAAGWTYGSWDRNCWVQKKKKMTQKKPIVIYGCSYMSGQTRCSQDTGFFEFHNNTDM